MGEETLRYLHRRRGPRHHDRQPQLAAGRGAGREAGRRRPPPGSSCTQLLVEADLVISTTGASEPIVTAAEFSRDRAEPAISGRCSFSTWPCRATFEPAIGDCMGVYLYSIDDLPQPASGTAASARRNGPQAERIIEEETARFMADLHHRATAPTIKRLKARADELKADELARLLNKLPDSTPSTGREIASRLRPAGQQAAAPAAGIAPRRSPARAAPRPARRPQAAVQAEGLTWGRFP